MQTLVFNTTDKTASVYSGQIGASELIFQFDNVSTIKPLDGFYEVMQRIDSETTPSGYTSIPILRVPILATNMRIVK
jgi:hypothetical protein